MKTSAISQQKTRYYLVDSIRGICVLGMIVYHILFDVVAFFNVQINPIIMSTADLIRDIGAFGFIFLSGICIHFGSRPLKRSLFLLASGVFITLITSLFVPDMRIIFGIITFMGSAGLLMIPLRKLLVRIPVIFGAIFSFLFFLLTFEVSNGYLGFYGVKLVMLPPSLYRNYFTAFFGFPFVGFFSGDYFPLFPWIFAFFCGFFCWGIIKNKKQELNFLKFRIKSLEKVGRYSFVLYLVHQPVIIFCIYIINSVLSKIVL